MSLTLSHLPSGQIHPLEMLGGCRSWQQRWGMQPQQTQHRRVLSCQPAGDSFPAQLWKQLICDILRQGRKYRAGEGRPWLHKYLLLYNVPGTPFSQDWKKKGLLAAGSGTCWQRTGGPPVGCLQREGARSPPSKNCSAGVGYCPAWPCFSLLHPTAGDVLLDHQELAWITYLGLSSLSLVLLWWSQDSKVSLLTGSPCSFPESSLGKWRHEVFRGALLKAGGVSKVWGLHHLVRHRHLSATTQSARPGVEVNHVICRGGPS